MGSFQPSLMNEPAFKYIITYWSLTNFSSRQQDYSKLPDNDMDSDSSRLFVGAVFATRAEAVAAIKTNALSKNRRVVRDKIRSGGNYIVLKCASKTPCFFEVAMSKSRNANPSQVTVKHTAPCSQSCTGNATIGRKQAAALSVVQNAVNSDMRISAASLIHKVQATVGVQILLRTAYRLIDDIIEKMYGSYTEVYQKLASFFAHLRPKQSRDAHRDLSSRWPLSRRVSEQPTMEAKYRPLSADSRDRCDFHQTQATQRSDDHPAHA